jgi:predicted Zn-dependent protease
MGLGHHVYRPDDGDERGLAEVNARSHFTNYPSHWLRRVIFAGLGLFLSLALAAPIGVSQPLPEFQTYPLPATLATLDAGDDYFDQITPTPVGALVWTKFPVTIAIDLAGAKSPREAVWLGAVRRAIADWNPYLPIVETTDLTTADITIRRASVPIQRDKAGKLQRIRLAETRFTFFTDADQQLRHRMTIALSPNQADAALQSGATHELGHALGLWGHSDQQTDVMHWSQVGQPVGISDRDLRTLKRVYEQPTRLGGKVGTAP